MEKERTTGDGSSDAALDWEWKSDGDSDSHELTMPHKLKDDMEPKDPELVDTADTSSELKDEALARTSDSVWDKKVTLKPSLETDKIATTISGSAACIERQRNIIKGIPNIGFTCFMNSMLQIFLAVGPLRREMLGPGLWSGPLAIALKQLFVETSDFWNQLFPSALLDPRPFHEKICSMWPVFKDCAMEDSSELIGLLLDALRDEEIVSRQISMDASNSEMVTTIIDSIFRGQEHSTVSSIECGHGSSRTQGFLALPLPIPTGIAKSESAADNDLHDSVAPVSIEDCFALYTEQSVLPQWYCEECTEEALKNKSERQGTAQVTNDGKDIDEGKEIVDGANKNNMEELEKIYRAATRRCLIASAPNVLVISLNRFEQVSDNQVEKLQCDVRFKERLDIQPYILERSENTVYRLVAIAEHRGDCTKGHYVAYVRADGMGHQQINGSKSWFFASDREIRKASVEEVLGCQAYVLVYERCSADAFVSCIKGTNEEPVAIDSDMLPQTRAPVYIPIPPSVDLTVLWEVQRHLKRDKRREQVLANIDAKVAKDLWTFLDGFILPGDDMHYYRGLLLSMVQMGFGLHELNIPYSHLLSFSRSLAMDVCNSCDRLGMKLSQTAREYMKILTKALNVVERVRKQMQQLEVKFLDMHKGLKQCLGTKVLRKPNVYGQDPIMIPVPEKIALVQGLIDHVLSKHRAGYSWEGDFMIDDIVVLDNNVLITKKPKLFKINPKISHEMVAAMEEDFRRIGTAVVKKFSHSKSYVPYLQPYYSLLIGIRRYASWWSSKVMAEALREWIQHYPFLKVSMARSNLLCGIHTACRAYDPLYDTMLFKKLSQRESVSGWKNEIIKTANQVLLDVLEYKDPSEDDKYYQQELEFLFEYFRHLAHHGTQSTFEFKPLVRRWDGPRQQLLQSLDELELAGAYRLEEFVVWALTILISHRAMKGMLLSVWECYKDCNSSYRNE